MHIVGISGSASPRSRSAWLLQLVLTRLEASASSSTVVALRELPAVPLLRGDAADPAIRAAVDATLAADLVVVSTPIYKASYSGLLKLFFDLLPADALRSKTVLPLATAGSPGHLLALDYALKPVLSVLGARDVLDGVFATDSQLCAHASGGFVPDPAVLARLDRAIEPLTARTPALAGVVAERCSS